MNKKEKLASLMKEAKEFAEKMDTAKADDVQKLTDYKSQIEALKEEAAAKLALCDDLMARLEAGEEFLTLENEYSEDAGRHTLTDGYILSRTTALPDEFIDAAFDMTVGEIRRVDASYATHIMLRCELPALGWNNPVYESLMGDFKEYVKSEVYAEKIAPMIEKITCDEDLMAKHTIVNTPITIY